MSFTRADFYGLNLDWYAQDADGQVAQFTTGFGPVPRAVFADEAAYRAASDYFQSAAQVCSSTLSPWARAQESRGIGNYSLALAEARRGLYSFEEEAYGPRHRLYAVPGAPVRLSSLPTEVQGFVSRFHLSGIRFIDIEVLDVLEYFDCVR
jgi:hypothetical protein